MAWSWTGGASGWTIPSLNVLIPPHQESTWEDQLTMVAVVVEEAVVVVAAEVAAAAEAAAGGEGETRITTVAMSATTDMTSMTIGTVAGALHRPTTVDTGLAHGLAPTAHGDTKFSSFNVQLPSNN